MAPVVGDERAACVPPRFRTDLTAWVLHDYLVLLNESADYAHSIFLAGWHLSDEAKFVDRRNRPTAGDELSVG